MEARESGSISCYFSLREPEVFREGALRGILLLVRGGEKSFQKPTYSVKLPADFGFSVHNIMPFYFLFLYTYFSTESIKKDLELSRWYLRL